MSLTGLVQGAFFVVVVVVLVILVQKDGGVQHEIAALKMPAAAPAPAHAASNAPPTGLGVTGALNGVSAATSASMNRSMATLENRGR